MAGNLRKMSKSVKNNDRNEVVSGRLGEHCVHYMVCLADIALLSVPNSPFCLIKVSVDLLDPDSDISTTQRLGQIEAKVPLAIINVFHSQEQISNIKCE